MKNIPDRNVILSFKGPININVLSFFGNYIKILVKEDLKTINRIFKIFIELTQNISYYSSEVKEINDGVNIGVGEFKLSEFKTHFEFYSANLILNEHSEKLMFNCSQVNSLNPDELRALKREKRKQSGVMDIGAHIGLIQVGLLSGNEYDFDVTKVDEDHSYFSLNVKIDKD